MANSNGLLEEGGITRHSLHNVEVLHELHGRVVCIEHIEHLSSSTAFYFADGYVYRADGFAAGYWGEAPTGLLKVFRRYLGRSDITRNHIVSWRGAFIYLVLPRDGHGKCLRHYSGVQDGEFTVEVW